jgi:hypothetical protein
MLKGKQKNAGGEEHIILRKPFQRPFSRQPEGYSKRALVQNRSWDIADGRVSVCAPTSDCINGYGRTSGWEESFILIYVLAGGDIENEARHTTVEGLFPTG